MRVEKHIDIDRTAADVFGFVSDQLNAPVWQRGLLEVERLTDGPIGVGTRHTFVRKVAGRRLEADNEYYEYEPNRKVAFRFISGSTSGGGSYQVEPVSPSRTRLTTSVEMHPTGLARLTEPLVSIAIKREVDANLATLKELLERSDRTVA